MRQKQSIFSLFLLSPSSRRAWIEIFSTPPHEVSRLVVLLAEGVDRNRLLLHICKRYASRPPRGGHG